MGKPKNKPSHFPQSCATRDLHDDSCQQNSRLIHSSKITSSIKGSLLRRLGRSSKGFQGYMCLACINSVSQTQNGPTRQGQLPAFSSGTHVEQNDTSAVKQIQTGCGAADISLNTDIVYVLSIPNLKNDVRALPDNFKAMLAFELASSERLDIRHDALSLTKGQNRQLNVLTSLCQENYLQSRNSVLVNFLSGLSVQNVKSASGYLPFPIEKPSDIYKIAKVTEACMGLTTPITVLPFHFRELVLLYSLTRSRMALTMLSSTAPHGSYQTVRTWLDKLASSDDNVKLPAEKGDYLCVFDNNQILQRRWKISVDNASVCRVITMVIFMDIDQEGTLQFQEELKPSHWMWKDLSPDKLESARQGHLNAIHQRTRYKKHFHPWLTEIIQEVAQEQKGENGKYVDKVDKHVSTKQHSKEFKTCPGCGFTSVPKRKRTCPYCWQKITAAKQKDSKPPATETQTKQTKRSNEGEIRVVVTRKQDATYGIEFQKTSRPRSEYDHLPQKHPTNPPKVNIGQPLFVNPCSYEAVAEVFRDIGRQAGIRRYGGPREWISIVCDGLPYVLGYQLIQRIFVCRICGANVSGEAECSTHQAMHDIECTFEREFDWILLQPGPGHIEMNMIKTFVKFSWPVFWESLVEVFNFRSEIAKKSALKVNDHHKGMTLARIAREAFAKELVLPYVRQEVARGDCNLSVAGFLKFTMSTVKSANYAFISDLIFIILDSIFLYRAGLRSGDVDMMDAGMCFFSRMWCARSHPMYRQLAANDAIMSACMPPSIFRFIRQTKSFNLSGVAYAGEGADFKLEEVNRGVQHWIPSAPTDKDWKNACANFTKLSELRRVSLADMELKDPKVRTFRPSSDIGDQVLAFRSVIRESEYLMHHDVDESLVSLAKEPLDQDLVNFARKAHEKEQVFLDSFVKYGKKGETGSSVPFKEPPIFVTPEERNEFSNIKNKTISECIALINLKIEEIEDDEMRNNFTEAFDQELISKKGKKPIKQDYLDFFALLEEFESTLITDSGERNDDQD